MMRRPFNTILIRGFVASVMLAAAAVPAAAQSGMCKVVDVPGSLSTSAQGINNRGDVAGWYVDGQGGAHGFMFVAGQFTTIDVPGAIWTEAFGINDAGVVVGAFGPQPVCNCVADLESSAFIYAGGGISTFSVGLSETWPLAVNNAGQMAGFYHDRDGDITDAERGFLMTGGGLTRIDAPGGGPLSEVGTRLTGINDAGTILGTAYDRGSYMFTWTNGQLTRVKNPPGATFVNSGGINKNGKLVGFYGDPFSSFVKTGKRYSDFDCPGADGSYLYGANDKGGMVGTSYTGFSSKGFYTPPITFVDPVPDLLNGQILSTLPAKLGSGGREVQGAAADAASVVVIRIPLANVNDPVTVTLLKTDNVGDVATSSDTDGALGTPDHNCCVFSVTARAQDTNNNGPMAFVTYRVPDDFPRPNGVDASVKSREVFFRFQSGGVDTTLPLKIVRPPVALLHGLWDDAGSWDTFQPLVTGSGTSDARFKVMRFSFNDPIGPQIGASSPVYPRNQLNKARANSLGFRYNAERVLVKMEQAIEDFKSGANPEKISVAAIGFDIVAHSMGGDVVRTMPLIDGYLKRRSFGQGIVHKMITLDTPHKGSPVATRMLSAQENNWCLRDLLADSGYLAFSAVAVGLEGVQGAVGDLIHNPPSHALQDIAAPGPKGIFTALYAGVLLDFSSLDPRFSIAGIIRFVCSDAPLARALKSNTWPLVFTDDGTHRSDGIVSHSSQANGLASVATSEGVLHSTGMRKLGFSGFVALDPGLFAVAVIDELNQSRMNPTHYTLLNP